MIFKGRQPKEEKKGLFSAGQALLALGGAIIGFALGSFNLYDRIVGTFFPAPHKVSQDYFVFGTGYIDAETDIDAWKDGFLKEFGEQISDYDFRLPVWVTDELRNRAKVVADLCAAWTADEYPGTAPSEDRDKFAAACVEYVSAEPTIGTYAIRNIDGKALSDISIDMLEITAADTPYLDLYDGFHTYALDRERNCITDDSVMEGDCMYTVAAISETTFSEISNLGVAKGVIVPVFVAWTLTFHPWAVEESGFPNLKEHYTTISPGPLRLPVRVTGGGREVIKARTMYKTPNIRLGQFEGRG